MVMNIEKQIQDYIASQPTAKQVDMHALHKLIVQLKPKCKLWFLNGKDENGKVVSNPNIGYGTQTMSYKDGSSREFYQIGLSANTAGISIYIMGINDKKYLAETYGKALGKASVTGYCIKFRTLKEVNIDVLSSAIQFGFEGKW